MNSRDVAHNRTALQWREHAWGRLGGRPGPRLSALAVADAGAPTRQGDVLARLGLDDDEFAQRIFARAGVRERYLNLDEGFLAANLQGRSADVEEALLQRACQAIDQLDVDTSSIGTLLTSSLYSLGCPSLAHRLIEHYRMRPDTDKYHVTGVGCASAVPLFRLAVQTLHANPSRNVLVVAAESMSSILVPARDTDPRAKTVGSAIFGDGCAAAVLSRGRMAGGPRILATRVHQVQDSLDAVQLVSEERDSHLDLTRELPEIAASRLRGLVHEFLRSQHLRVEQVDHWLVHPGGRRILERARDALELSDHDVAISWGVLAERGNVGTPSIFYVLHDTIEQRAPSDGEYGLAVTVGPGVTLGLMLIEF
jgi:alkylresorcinol/alkylpyrone synthase